jgi:hypothetical protein
MKPSVPYGAAGFCIGERGHNPGDVISDVMGTIANR